MNDTLFASGGYRLDIFQLYNWGVFDKAIYTLDCKSKSSLLTGENGSGKTTVVDAIVSLLVPPQARYYNQSSGTDKKRDRTEETYVLGAYGNKQDEETSGIKAQSLRDRDTFSILNGCFTNDDAQNTISLLQVRYFSGDALQHVFALTKQRLSIEDIQAFLKTKGMAIDRKGEWKRAVSNRFNTVFFDSFAKYSDAFMAPFGFCSEKALRLFSQTVGLKVLGNLTEFIRTNMLEDVGAEKRFVELEENYKKLMDSFNVIQKTEKQIELLKPIMETGDKWEKAQADKSKFELFKSTIPLWYAENALAILTAEQKEKQEKLEATEAHRKSTVESIDGIQKEIDSINRALALNEKAQHITELQGRIEQLEAEKQRIQAVRSLYEEKLRSAGLSLPRTEKEFFATLKNIESNLTHTQESEKQNEDALFDTRTKENELLKQRDEIKKELESLGNRNSNIPLENVSIRSRICSAIHCEEAELPFAGELMQVSPEEQQWSKSIEKLLHNFALDILVPEQWYAKVTSFVKDTDLNGRVVYLRTGDNFSLSEDNKTAARNTVPGKLQFKQNSQFTKWIESYIPQHFNYICTDDIAELKRADNAITSTGLIKNKIRHEKDDRKLRPGDSLQVLGWDNKQKKQELSASYDDVQEAINTVTVNEQKAEKEKEKIAEEILNLNLLAQQRNWDDIDTESRAKKIDTLTDEKKKLESKATDVRDLNAQLDQKNKTKGSLAEELAQINQEKGRLDDKLSDIARRIAENNAAWNIVSDAEKQKVFEQIDLLCKAYPAVSNARTVSELDINRAKILEENSSRATGCLQTISALEKSLVRYMHQIKNPEQEIRNVYGDWSSEFTDLGDTTDSLNDYEQKYTQLEKEDLPSYKNKFREYLHDTMNQDIIDFNQFIKNQEKEITDAIENLNKSLKAITYNQNPDTFLQLEAKKVTDMRIKEFEMLLHAALPDAYYAGQFDEKKENEKFQQMKRLLDKMQKNENDRRFILDLRNWFAFSAKEKYVADKAEKQTYENTASLSGGEKAKLTYTILASAIAYQFGIVVEKTMPGSFRFVIIDEAFSKSDAGNSDYAMKLFKQLDLQLMVITPYDKINIVENYISSVHITENYGKNDSRILHMSIEEYKETAARKRAEEERLQ
jgi:uncharacterized protein YPO0396